jgi:hypothetical protein
LILLQKIIDDRKLNLLDRIEKVAEDGKVITDKIKNIIFESMLMNIMPLTKKKPKMKMVLRIQRSVLLTFDFNFFDFLRLSLLLLKV